METDGIEIPTTDGLEFPGDIGWIVLLVTLIAIAWHVGILKESAARRAMVAGAGVALITLPVTVVLWNVYSFSDAILAAVFYGPVVTVMLLVWFRDRIQTGVPT